MWLWVCEANSLSSSFFPLCSFLFFLLTLSRYLATHTHTGINTQPWTYTGQLTVLNEFVAYLELVHNETLSPRSVAVATYALCCFSV